MTTFTDGVWFLLALLAATVAALTYDWIANRHND